MIERVGGDFQFLALKSKTEENTSKYVATQSNSVLLSPLGLSHRVAAVAMLGASLGRRNNIVQMTQRMVRYT